ncbi:MAG: hypothetical protein FWF10_09680 [Clostridiales bacterium]|nr:hypothetical protein [Clostridiales bacterium]
MIGLEAFIEYHGIENENACMEHRVTFRLTDDEVKKLMKRICKCDTAEAFHYIKKLKEAGVSIRQISRLTGVSKGVVERA